MSDKSFRDLRPIWQLALFLCLLNPLISQTFFDTRDTLKVLTFNLYGAPNSNWSERQQLVLDELTMLQPDIVGFQEVIQPTDSTDNRVAIIADSLLARLGIHYNYIYQRTHFSWGMWDEGVAIMSPHLFLEEDALLLPAGEFQRALVYARLVTPAGVVNMYNVHLSHGDQEPVRIGQVNAVREFVTDHQQVTPAQPHIVTGDFNSIPGSAPIQLMISSGDTLSFIDSWGLIHPGDPGFTMPATNPSARIDYVFVQDNVTATVVDAEIVMDEPGEGNLYPSDHLGVLGTLSTELIKLALEIHEPSPAATVAGQIDITWSIAEHDEPLDLSLLLSDDGGRNWDELWSGSDEVDVFTWNSSLVPDGTQYLLRLSAYGDSSFGQVQMTDRFTVDNPGNSPPELDLIYPRGGEDLEDLQFIRWGAVDVENDPISIDIQLSADSGLFWTDLVLDHDNTGSYAWNTLENANSTDYQLRLHASDDSATSTATTGIFSINNARDSLSDSLFQHISGSGGGTIRANVVDSTLITGDSYRITFDDSSQTETSYSVRDLTADSTLFTGVIPLDGTTEGPAFSGVRLLVFDHLEAVVDDARSGWTEGGATLQYVISLTSLSVDGNVLEPLPYPADYRIDFYDDIADTSSEALGGLEIPVTFTVGNLTEDLHTDFHFMDNDSNGSISYFDELILIEHDEAGQVRPGWYILFGLFGNLPEAGDVFSLTTLKPFTAADVFEFTLPELALSGSRSSSRIPVMIDLDQNYPNPFNPSTNISYRLSGSARVSLTIFDLRGRQIRELVNADQHTGSHTVKWDGKTDRGKMIAAGIYLARLKAGGSSRVIKLIYM